MREVRFQFLKVTLVAITILLSPQIIKAETIYDVKTLYPSADTFISSEHLTDNPGTQGSLSVGFFPTINNEVRRILVKFDLAPIPSTATVSTASLNLYMVPESCSGTINPQPNQLTIGQNISDWVEVTTGWNNKPGYIVSQNYSTPSCPANWYYMSTTDIVKNWISGQPNYGFQVVGSNGGSQWYRNFKSREATETWARPQLVVSYSYPRPDEPAPPSSDPPAGSDPQSNSTDNSSDANSSAASSSSSTISAAATSAIKKTVDASVAPPTLNYVIRGEARTDAPIADEIIITTGDIIKIGGGSFANAGIAVMIGDNAFTGLSDKTGVWELTIDTREIATGSYKVMAQSQDIKKDTGSAEVELFSIKVNDNATTSAQKTAAEDAKKSSLFEKMTGIYKWHVLSGLIILTLGCFGLLYYLLRKRKLSASNKVGKTAEGSQEKTKA